MTRHTTQAGADHPSRHPTTKSHCPAGAGIINQPAAPEEPHTPPQACATPAIDLACQPPSEAPHAQLAEGYKHPFPVRRQIPDTDLGRKLEARLKAADSRLAKAEARPDTSENRAEVKHLLTEFRAALSALKSEAVRAESEAAGRSAPLGIDSEGGNHD